MTRPPDFNPLRFTNAQEVADARRLRIAQLAYARAESRGFEPGHEEEDWLAAEAELEAQIQQGFRPE